MSKERIASNLGNPIGALIGDESNGTIWNNNPQYSVPSLSESANEISGSGLDPFGMVAGIWNDLTGVTSQSREFAQQEYLQDKMNEYNSPANQMARMRAAGINPNTAAAGISNGGNESAQAPQVSSNTNGASSALGSLASAAGAAFGAPASLAAAGLSAAQSNEILSLLDLNKGKILAETENLLTSAGLNVWNSRSIATMLPHMEYNAVADFYNKMAAYNNTCAEYDNIKATHEKILADIKVQEAQLPLMEAQRLQIEEDTRWKKQENDFFEQYGYRPDSSTDVALRNSIVSGRYEQAEMIGDGVYKWNYESNLARYTAEVNTIYDKASKEAHAQYEKEIRLRFEQMQMDKELQNMLLENGVRWDLIKSIFEKYILGKGFAVKVGPFGGSSF